MASAAAAQERIGTRKNAPKYHQQKKRENKLGDNLKKNTHRRHFGFSRSVKKKGIFEPQHNKNGQTHNRTEMASANKKKNE